MLKSSVRSFCKFSQKEADQSFAMLKISPYGQAGRLPGGIIRIID